MARFSGSAPIRLAICFLLIVACAGHAQSEWRPVDPDDLIILETRHGKTFIELTNDFAPRHIARIRQLVRAGFYDGEYFYRVIDGFMAQAGAQPNGPQEDWPALENEADRATGTAQFTALGNHDLFAPLVGHIAGFPVARDDQTGREWLVHCPGAVAMARAVGPNTATTEFYIVLDAQRHLDRNLTIFGRVIAGMEHIQALRRGEPGRGNGVIQPPEKGDQILSMRLASDVPASERQAFEVLRTSGTAFAMHKRNLRVHDGDFFYRKPPEILDICGFQVPAQRR